jgi:hypothetical protein
MKLAPKPLLSPQSRRVLQTVAGVVIAVLFISQTASHGCPLTDKFDPATVFSSALSARAVLCLTHQGGAFHPTKCRPDAVGTLTGLVAARVEALHKAVTAPHMALHLACSSRELLLLKSHLLI